jgi:tetratricopeptide (TPR) repeat protein
MAEDRKLDAHHTPLRRGKGRPWLLPVLALLMLALAGCGLPRIVVLNDPLSPEEHINLGVAYEKDGEYEQALKQYEAAKGDLPIAHLYMGNVLFLQGRYGKAEKNYREAIEKTDDPRAYNNLAWLFFTRGERLDEARTLAREAVAREPDSEQFRDTLEQIEGKVAPRGEGSQ